MESTSVHQMRGNQISAVHLYLLLPQRCGSSICVSQGLFVSPVSAEAYALLHYSFSWAEAWARGCVCVCVCEKRVI